MIVAVVVQESHISGKGGFEHSRIAFEVCLCCVVALPVREEMQKLSCGLVEFPRQAGKLCSVAVVVDLALLSPRWYSRPKLSGSK